MEFRQALAAKLKELMLKDETICILDADLAKPNGTAPLYKEFPNRCFNVGIAEANMVGVAAGLAASNMKPNVFSFAPFSTRRALDQIMISIILFFILMVLQTVKLIINRNSDMQYVGLMKK